MTCLLSVQEDVEQVDEVCVEQRDFQSSLLSLTPSLSQDELKRYEVLREKYEGARWRCFFKCDLILAPSAGHDSSSVSWIDVGFGGILLFGL